MKFSYRPLAILPVLFIQPDTGNILLDNGCSLNVKNHPQFSVNGSGELELTYCGIVFVIGKIDEGDFDWVEIANDFLVLKGAERPT